MSKAGSIFSAEAVFKNAVHHLCILFETTGHKNVYPSPANINRRRNKSSRNSGGEQISGRESKWRREVFVQRGWYRRDGLPVIDNRRSWNPGPGAFGYYPPTGTYAGDLIARGHLNKYLDPSPVKPQVDGSEVQLTVGLDSVTLGSDVRATTVKTGQRRTGTTASEKGAGMAQVISSEAPKRGVVTIGLTSENLGEIEAGGEVRIPNGRYEIVLVSADLDVDDTDGDALAAIAGLPAGFPGTPGAGV